MHLLLKTHLIFSHHVHEKILSYEGRETSLITDAPLVSEHFTNNFQSVKVNVFAAQSYFKIIIKQ